jgi:hypothetical protein
VKLTLVGDLSITVTAHVAVLPFRVVIVIIAVPTALAVIMPLLPSAGVKSLPTEATAVSLLVNVTVPVAVSGDTSHSSWNVSPMPSGFDGVCVNLTLVGNVGSTTVTVHVAVFPPIDAVITAVPAALAVIIPFVPSAGVRPLVTVATAVLLLVNDTTPSASEGVITQSRMYVSPMLRESAVGETVIPVGCIASQTAYSVTLEFAV